MTTMTKHEKVNMDIGIDLIRAVALESKRNIVLGLSGGIDSAVALMLAIHAVGADTIMAIMLPYKDNQNLVDAVELAEECGIKYEVISITDIVDSFQCKDEYRKANIMARVRMTILYDRAMYHNALVLGTTNLSEYYLGYFTKWGDGAVDLEPLLHMTKTEIFEVAKYILPKPEVFINKKPSADLWEGQNDEGELNLTYANVDKIIEKFYDQFNSMNYIEEFEDFLQLQIENTSPFYADEYNTLVELRRRFMSSLHKLNPTPRTYRLI